jgi:hypothetical protein
VGVLYVLVVAFAQAIEDEGGDETEAERETT